MADDVKVKIAGDAIDSTGQDISVPTQELLRDLSLLPRANDLKEAGEWKAALLGPPDSVSVIEAGATAASKWWATAIGVGGAAVSARIVTIWGSLGGDWVKSSALLSVAVVVGATAIGISYLLASDVRGRAAAMVATIEARRDVAIAMANQAAAVSVKKGTTTTTMVPLPGLVTENVQKGAADEAGWKAIAMREAGGGDSYLLVKGEKSEWVEAKGVKFG